MRKIATKIFCVLSAILCCAVIIGTAVCIVDNQSHEILTDDLQVIEIWQIDSFEGGKGSRAEYLKSLGSKFSKENNVYIEVTALSAEAVRENIEDGVLPDIISYGSGFYGLEGVINTAYKTYVWCRGGYCLLSIKSENFSNVNEHNTVINAGKDNYTMAEALFCGLQGADVLQPTSAYVNLINGKYEFLLGTQRDIVRLITREIDFFVCPLTEFNDMYQNISIISTDSKKSAVCKNFIEYILSECENLSQICMFFDGVSLYENKLNEMEGLTYKYTIPAVISKRTNDEINYAIETSDINKLKSLLKLL